VGYGVKWRPSVTDWSNDTLRRTIKYSTLFTVMVSVTVTIRVSVEVRFCLWLRLGMLLRFGEWTLKCWLRWVPHWTYHCASNILLKHHANLSTYWTPVVCLLQKLVAR